MMDGLAQVYFSQGWWLLALPLPWLAWRLLRQRDRQRLGALVPPHLWRWMIRTGHARKAGYSRLFVTAWVLSIIALSGPHQRNETPGPTARQGADIAVIVDISPSMNVRDVLPDRLQRARFELHDFLARLRGERVALLAYSANAYRLLPLTSDYPVVRHFIDALDTRLTRQQGSNLTQALEMAGQLLAGSREGSRAILVVSDGESHDRNSVLQAGARLAARGIPVYALGVGTRAGGPVHDARGQFLRHEGVTVISRLDGALLAGLAQRSGGRYAPMQGGDGDWDVLFAGLRELARANPYPEARRQNDRPLYPWILATGLLLFLWWGAWRMTGAAVMILLLALPPLPRPAQATPWQEQQAYRALRAGDDGRAAKLYQSLGGFRAAMGRGVAAYRLRQWERAATAFEEARQLAGDDAQRARAAYNLGNALARQGRLDAAARAYRAALRWQDNYPRATLNLNLVEQARQRRNPATPPTAETAMPGPGGKQRAPARGDEYRFDGTHRREGAQRQGPAGENPPPEGAAIAGGGEHRALQSFLLPPAADQAGMIVRLRIGEQDARYGRILVEKPW